MQVQLKQALDALFALLYIDGGILTGRELNHCKKITYCTIRLLEVNQQLTSNQLCSMLRRTLSYPEDTVRKVITALAKDDTVVGLKRVFIVSAPQADRLFVSLAKNQQWVEVKALLGEEFPELTLYNPTLYSRSTNYKGGDRNACSK